MPFILKPSITWKEKNIELHNLMNRAHTAHDIGANEIQYNTSGFKIKLKICGVQFILWVEIYPAHTKK